MVEFLSECSGNIGKIPSRIHGPWILALTVPSFLIFGLNDGLIKTSTGIGYWPDTHTHTGKRSLNIDDGYQVWILWDVQLVYVSTLVNRRDKRTVLRTYFAINDRTLQTVHCKSINCILSSFNTSDPSIQYFTLKSQYEEHTGAHNNKQCRLGKNKCLQTGLRE